jgi:Ca2+-transporting ATPase
MTTLDQTTEPPASSDTAWYSLSPQDTAARLEVEADAGLTSAEVDRRLAQYGRNEVATEPPPTLWETAKGQIANPMNIMLLIVAVASIAIGQLATGIIVGALVTFNVVMGTNQERKALASVDALAQLQVPMARVRRDGTVIEVDSSGLVPGDVVLVEAGDLVPADARVVSSASLEVQEAALTGESAPIAKNTKAIAEADVPLGDRTNLVFQNTQVTRGSAEVMVVATGQTTQMGQIANMVTATKRTKSPLQVELDDLTKIFGFLAWGAVAIIAIVGIARGQETETLILLCVSTAISAIPTGLPTFVQLMLSSGAQRLA